MLFYSYDTRLRETTKIRYESIPSDHYCPLLTEFLANFNMYFFYHYRNNIYDKLIKQCYSIK